MAAFWYASAAATFVALCSVPYLVAQQLNMIAGLERAERNTREQLNRAAVWSYRRQRLRAYLSAGALFAMGAGYLYLIGSHLGLLR